MTFYQIEGFSSIFLLHSLVIAKSNFRKSADQFAAEIDQLICRKLDFAITKLCRRKIEENPSI